MSLVRATLIVGCMGIKQLPIAFVVVWNYANVVCWWRLCRPLVIRQGRYPGHQLVD